MRGTEVMVKDPRVLTRLGARCVVVAFVPVAILACGGSVDGGQTGEVGPCKSGLVGEWTGVTRADHLSIFPDRSFRYTGADGCSNQGSIGSCPDSNVSSGTLEIVVQKSTGSTCLPLGNHSCAFTLNGNAFSYDCTGGGSLEYTR